MQTIRSFLILVFAGLAFATALWLGMIIAGTLLLLGATMALLARLTHSRRRVDLVPIRIHTGHRRG